MTTRSSRRCIRRRRALVSRLISTSSSAYKMLFLNMHCGAMSRICCRCLSLTFFPRATDRLCSPLVFIRFVGLIKLDRMPNSVYIRPINIGLQENCVKSPPIIGDVYYFIIFYSSSSLNSFSAAIFSPRLADTLMVGCDSLSFCDSSIVVIPNSRVAQ